MIIDFRLRPPVLPFTKMRIYGAFADYAKELGEPTDPAADKDISVLFKEMEELEIVHGVCAGRIDPLPERTTSNDEIAEVIKKYPGKFTGFAAIDHRNIPKAMAETERCFKKLGLKGIDMDLTRFWDPPTNLDDPTLYPIYDLCQSLGIPVMSTLGGHPVRDITQLSPIIVEHVARDFPKMIFIIAHGCWPYVDEVTAVCMARKNIYLMADYYGARFPGHMGYVEAANTFLQDRMLYGSAFPNRNMALTIKLHRALPFRPEVAEKYFYGNAARLLGLNK